MTSSHVYHVILRTQKCWLVFQPMDGCICIIRTRRVLYLVSGYRYVIRNFSTTYINLIIIEPVSNYLIGKLSVFSQFYFLILNFFRATAPASSITLPKNLYLLVAKMAGKLWSRVLLKGLFRN